MTDSPQFAEIAGFLTGEGQERSDLLPLLFKAQDQYGYVPAEAIEAISRHLKITREDILEVIRGYEMFLSRPAEKTVIRICTDPVCVNAGAGAFMRRLAEEMDAHAARGEPVGAITVEYAACLGLCEHAPAVTLGGTPLARVDNLTYQDLVEGKIRHPRSIVRSEFPILTENCGKNQVSWLIRYSAAGGYKGLAQALKSKPEDVIGIIRASGLYGRGGGGYPTAQKLENLFRQTSAPKYIVCNAAEAEPGSYKYRVLLEDDPHRILEGMVIAGFAAGAHKGYLMVRGEYVYQTHILQRALEEAQKAGLVGGNILGSGFSFDIEIRRCAGRFVSGEETALLKVIEGYPPIPDKRPPYPSEKGLFGQPTIVNNVETLANLPYILRVGAEKFRELGTAGSPGTKLYCLSGDITMPGLYEVPLGITMRHLVEELAGGVRGRKPLQAVLFGGAVGTFLTPDELDIRLSRETLREARITLGSGVITVFDDTRDLKQVLQKISSFFAAETCAKCSACLNGTRRQDALIRKGLATGLTSGEVDLLMDDGWNAADQSICGLGQYAGQAVRSALKRWPALFSDKAE